MTENNLHTFTLIDSQIFLALAYADKKADISCMDLIASCVAVNNSIPDLAEFAEVFNKFLYVSAIGIAGDKLTFANFGREIMNKVRSKASADAQSGDLVELVQKELAGYKLKSMCNRSVWTQEQYQQAVNVHGTNLKL